MRIGNEIDGRRDLLLSGVSLCLHVKVHDSLEENEMACELRAQRRIRSTSLLTVIIVLLTAIGVTSEPAETETRAKASAATPKLTLPWNDELIEKLPPAPKAARTSKKYSWERQQAKRDRLSSVLSLLPSQTLGTRLLGAP